MTSYDAQNGENSLSLYLIVLCSIFNDGVVNLKLKKNILQESTKVDKLSDDFKSLDIKFKSVKKRNGESEKLLKNILPENELTFAFYPREFPKKIFTEEYVEFINEMIDALKSQIPYGEIIPGIIYMIFEGGYCKTKVANIFTKKWIIGIIANLIYQGMPLTVSSVKSIPKCFYSTSIPGEVLDDLTILTTINRQNEDINSSRWSILSKRQDEFDFFAVFEVDAINAHVIESLNRMLFFGAGQILFGLEEIIDQDTDN